MRSRVMDVRCKPHDVVNAVALDEAQESRDFQFSSERRAIAVCEAFETRSVLGIAAVSDDNTDGQVACNHFPDRARSLQVALEPFHLVHSKKSSVAVFAFLAVE